MYARQGPYGQQMDHMPYNSRLVSATNVYKTPEGMIFIDMFFDNNLLSSYHFGRLQNTSPCCLCSEYIMGSNVV